MSDTVETEKTTKKQPADPTSFEHRLRPSEWIQAEVLYQSGDFSLLDIRNKFGGRVSEISLRKRFRRRGIIKGSHKAEFEEQVASAVRRKLEQEVEIVATRQKEAKEDYFRISKFLAVKTQNLLVNAESTVNAKGEKGTISNAYADIKTLKLAAEVFEKSREMRWEALGMNKDGMKDEEIPTLQFLEMTAEEVETLRKAQSQSSQALAETEEREELTDRQTEEKPDELSPGEAEDEVLDDEDLDEDEDENEEGSEDE